MSPIIEAMQQIAIAIETLKDTAAGRRQKDMIVEVLEEARRVLDEIRPACLQCGGENHRRGDYCTDRCRAVHYRQRMPRGTVKSVRRLTKGKASIVVHYTPEEADRAVAIKVNESVWLAGDVL